MRFSWTIAVALLVSGCGSTKQAGRATGNFGPETLTLINSYRVSRGLSPLATNGTLQALARQHSQYQSSRNTLSHNGFRERSARAKAAGLSVVCAENAGYNYKNAQQLSSDGEIPRATEQTCFDPICAMLESP